MLRGALCAALLTATAAADTWYVNNAAGDDANDGRSAETAFATLARAAAALKTSDRLIIANTGRPYYESLRLIHTGGTPARPMIVEGNGAVLSGLRAVWIPHDKLKRKEMRELAAQVRRFESKAVRVVDNWNEIEQVIFDDGGQTPQQFADRLERLAAGQ